MNLNEIMARQTLRQMGDAQQLWRDHVGPDGAKFQDALSAGDFTALAAMVAAKMRTSGHPGFTVDDALDLELDTDSDAEGEANAGNSGGPLRLSADSGG